MKNSILLYFVVISFGFSSCNWLPPSPNEPFYCKVNGKKYRPQKTDFVSLKATWNSKDGSLYISTRNSPQEIGLFIFMKNKELSISDYTLSNDKLATKGLYTPNNGEIPSQNLISTSGNVSITKVEGYNIWGTFEFTCKSTKTGTEYNITKGEFNNLSYY